MKLLLDENLSHTLADSVQEIFPGSRHVRHLGLIGQSDRLIWKYAREQGYVIASKNSDFNERVLLMEAPPRLIGLRIGKLHSSGFGKTLGENSE